jgi:hypothetical protein
VPIAATIALEMIGPLDERTGDWTIISSAMVAAIGSGDE